MTKLLKIQRFHASYITRQGEVKACRDIDLEISKGETLGLIGETGCGKSTLALSILRLLPANSKVSGEIIFQGQNLLSLDPEEMRKHRGRQIALIPQSSATCLNPVLQIGKQLKETLHLHQRLSPSQAQDKAVAMLEHLNFADAAINLKRYPYQLSGGMKQRVLAALGLAGNPSLLIADEPTKGLDAVARYQVAETLHNLSHETKTGTIIITHDLKLASRLCDRIAVMYGGEIVEQGSVHEVLQHPFHPYTAALMNSLPGKQLTPIPGSSPDLITPSAGCCFFPRCIQAKADCNLRPPVMQDCSKRQVRCNYYASGKELDQNLLFRPLQETAI